MDDHHHARLTARFELRSNEPTSGDETTRYGAPDSVAVRIRCGPPSPMPVFSTFELVK
jgi:hypothetical protein